MRRVVVTGAKGGTGPSIVNAFRDAGWDVLGVDLKPCALWETGYRQVDLRDGASVYEICAGAQAIVHFGSLPTDSWTSWQTAYENLLGDTTQLEILQSRSLARRVVERLELHSDPRFNAPVGSGFIDKLPAALGFLREMAEGLPLIGSGSGADSSLGMRDKTGLAVDFFLKNH